VCHLGWSDPEGSRPNLGALLVGYFTDDGKPIYAGRVGTGMPIKVLVEGGRGDSTITQQCHADGTVP
jgi:hypothetical protein